MITSIKFNKKGDIPLYIQIADELTNKIESRDLSHGYVLPSITLFSKQLGVSRDTIERAYKTLQKTGYLKTIKGIGCFVNYGKSEKIKVLLLFNKISNFKKEIYYSFINSSQENVVVDLFIYHYSPLLFNDILEKNIGKYDFYVVMPHFESDSNLEDYKKTINNIPKEKLILLDNILPEVNCSKVVYQDFENDIYNSLIEAKSRLTYYSYVVLIISSESHHPKGIIWGVEKFCLENNKSFTIEENALLLEVSKNTLYIMVSDDDLVCLIKKQRLSQYQIGKDFGMISFNETELKELLDITVVSTDFVQMGKFTAEFIQTNKNEIIKNPFKMILRGSI